MTDDAQLIEATLAGQATAFGQLVSRYQDRLYHAVVHVTGATEDARDVVQDAFVQAFVKLHTFRGNSAFYTWLYRIALNLAISHCRRRRPTVSLEQAREATGHQPVDDGDGPAAGLEQQERAAQLQQALALLSDEHRTILVLREMEEYSYDEIAELLDLPIGTVRSRLYRARLQLRDELRKVMQEEIG